MLKKAIFAATLLLIVVSVAILNLERNTKLLIQYYWEDYWSLKTDTVIFVGSSTIARLNRNALFRCEPLRIRGFESSVTSDALRYMKTLPMDKIKSVVLYVGENDIAYGTSSIDAIKEFKHLLDYINTARAHVSDKEITVAILTLKNSPQRQTHHRQFEQFNAQLRRLNEANSNLVFVPLASIKSKAYYMSDGIHLNLKGYKLLNFWLNDFCDKNLP